MHDIVIVGAGAMGCLFAVRLAETGARVVLIDVDEERLAALRRDGVTLADDHGERTVMIEAARAAEIVAPVDLVLLFTKAMHSKTAARSVAHLAATAQALTLQNGIGNAEALADVFPPDQVLMGVTDFPADLEGPTRISSHGQGHVRIAGFTDAADAGPVAALLTSAGLAAQVAPDVRAAIWEKVAFNAALNAMAAVTGRTVGGMDAPPGRRIAAAVAGEVVATASAHAIVLDRAGIDRKIDFALTHHQGHKASMLQDLQAGRTTEIEAINGAVVRAAHAAGLAVPVTETLADLVRLMEHP
jgi:2-dehydropantoate 2-reductase